MISEIFVPPYDFDVRWRLSLLFPGEKKKNFNQDTTKESSAMKQRPQDYPHARETISSMHHFKRWSMQTIFENISNQQSKLT